MKASQPGIFLLAAFITFAVLPHGQMKMQSSDLEIENGTTISIDGKVAGVAPLTITLVSDVRHRLDAKAGNGSARTYFVTARTLKESDVVNNMPAWFLDPSVLQSSSAGYAALTTATAVAATLHDAIHKAEDDVKRRIPSGMVGRYSTVREGQGRLDSTSSSTYPKLTRGQMDSLADVNGGRLVAQSMVVDANVSILELEIQKAGKEYRVYVLAGKDR